jgi:hypothetical protein
MDKKVTINIVVLILVAITSLLIGTMFHGPSEVELSEFKRKYDSAKTVITKNEKALKETAVERDSARSVLSQLKYQVVQLNNTIAVRDVKFQKERAYYRDKLMGLSDEELAKEARVAYIREHSAPLFDTVDLGPLVRIERQPVIHLLEQDKKAEHLEKENADLKELDSVRGKEVSNLLYQVSKYQTDSAAFKGIVDAQNVIIESNREEKKAMEKEHKKELRRQKAQKVVATAVAVASLVAAIVF